jgi:uncharacterized protein YcbX
MTDYAISSLFIHPVKSLKAVSVSSASVGALGFQSDRRYMLVDSSGQFITQRKYPQLTKITALLTGDSLKLSGDVFNGRTLSFGIKEFKEGSNVTVWSDSVEALLINDERTRVISDLIGVEASLAYMPDSTFRQVDRAFFADDQAVSFADGFPFLLTNEASLNDLNRRLDEPVSMRRFRPNIVFKGGLPFQEDEWKRIAIGDVEFALVKPCSRCVMTGIDEQGVRHKEPLATLATYRKNEFGVCFGQNMVQLSSGRISVGDKLRVIE